MDKFNSVKEFYDYYEGGAKEVGLNASVVFGIKNLASELKDKENRDMLFKMSKAYGWYEDIDKLIKILTSSSVDYEYLGVSDGQWARPGIRADFILELFISLVDYRKILPEHIYLLDFYYSNCAKYLSTGTRLLFFKDLTAEKRTLRNFLIISGSPCYWQDNKLKEAFESMRDFEDHKKEYELLIKIRNMDWSSENKIKSTEQKKLINDYLKLLVSEKIISDDDREQVIKIIDQKKAHDIFPYIHDLVYNATDKKIKYDLLTKTKGINFSDEYGNKNYRQRKLMDSHLELLVLKGVISKDDYDQFFKTLREKTVNDIFSYMKKERKIKDELLVKIKNMPLTNEDENGIKSLDQGKLIARYLRLFISQGIISNDSYYEIFDALEEQSFKNISYRLQNLFDVTIDKKIKSGEWNKEHVLLDENNISDKSYDSIKEFCDACKDNNIEPSSVFSVLNIKHLLRDLGKEENIKLLADLSNTKGWNKNLDELVEDIYEEFIPIMTQKFSSIESNPSYGKFVVLKLLLSLAGDKKISLKHIYKLGCISESFRDETLLAFRSLSDNERTLKGLLSIPISFWINKYESLYRESTDYIDEAFRSIPGFENYEAEYKLLTKITDMFSVYGEKIEEAEKKKLINDYLELLVSQKIISDTDRDQALEEIKHENLNDPEDVLDCISFFIRKTTTEKMKSGEWENENALLNKDKVFKDNYKPVLDSESIFEKRKKRRKALRKTIRYVDSKDEYNNIRDFHDYWIKGDCVIEVFFRSSNVLGIKNLARDLETEENRNLLADLSNSYKWNENLDKLVNYINKKIVPKIDKNAKHLGLQEADQIVPPSWKAFILRFFLSMAGDKKISFEHLYMLDCVSGGYPSVNLLFFKSLPDDERTLKNLLSIATFPWDWDSDWIGVSNIETKKINFIREAVESLCDFNEHKAEYEKMIELFEKISNRHKLSDDERKKVIDDYLKLLVSKEVISDDDYKNLYKNANKADIDHTVYDFIYEKTSKKIKSDERSNDDISDEEKDTDSNQEYSHNDENTDKNQFDEVNKKIKSDERSNDDISDEETDTDSNQEYYHNDENTDKNQFDKANENIKPNSNREDISVMRNLEPNKVNRKNNKIIRTENKPKSFGIKRFDVQDKKRILSFEDLFSHYPNFFDFTLDEMLNKSKSLVGEVYSKESKLKRDLTVLKQIEECANQPDEKKFIDIDIKEAKLALWWILQSLHTEDLISDKEYSDLNSRLNNIDNEPNKIVEFFLSIRDLIVKLVNKVIGKHKFMDDFDRKKEERKEKIGVLTNLYKQTKNISKNPKKHHENKHPELDDDTFH